MYNSLKKQILQSVEEAFDDFKEVVTVSKQGNYYVALTNRFVLLKMNDLKMITLKFEVEDDELVIKFHKNEYEKIVRNVKLEESQKEKNIKPEKESRNIKEDSSEEETTIDPSSLKEDENTESSSEESVKKHNEKSFEQVENSLSTKEQNFLSIKKPPAKAQPEEDFRIRKIKLHDETLIFEVIEGKLLHHETSTDHYFAFLPIGKGGKELPCAVSHKNKKGEFTSLDEVTKKSLSESKIRFINPAVIEKLRKAKYSLKNIEYLNQFCDEEEEE
ncbi:MAG TPA: hypothetical protein VLE02_01935 [Nitrosarchaeum sp.]|nr:hypothetical protein [Nitrosarchaeum sp.]